MEYNTSKGILTFWAETNWYYKSNNVIMSILLRFLDPIDNKHLANQIHQYKHHMSYLKSTLLGPIEVNRSGTWRFWMVHVEGTPLWDKGIFSNLLFNNIEEIKFCLTKVKLCKKQDPCGKNETHFTYLLVWKER